MRDGHVDGNAIHPRRELHPLIESRIRAPHLDQHFLHKVLPVVAVATVHVGDLEKYPLVFFQTGDEFFGQVSRGGWHGVGVVVRGHDVGGEFGLHDALFARRLE